MPWASFETNGKFCVFALDADNNKKGEALECYPTREAAQTYVKGLYAKEKKAEKEESVLHHDHTLSVVAGMLESFKAGARHSSNDNSLIQKTHDMLCELGAACKEQPRGGPFESTDKLTIFKDASGKYRWVSFSSSAFRDRDKEIVSTKALADDVARADADGKYGPLRFWHEPGLDIGYTDFNAMEGRVLVESGGFHDERIGEALKDYQDELGLSIGFTHPADEPDASGTYHNIRRFERSIVPADKASNLLTQFVVKEEGINMEDTKKNLLEKLIGTELAAKWIGKAQDTQKTAEESGLKFKETEGEHPHAVDPPSAEVKAEPTGLTEGDVKALINKAFAEYDERKGAATKEIEAQTTKETSELMVTLKAMQEGQAEMTKAVTMALQGVAELKGELPRSQTGAQPFFRPSQDGPSIEQLARSNNALGESMKELAGNPSDPFAKFYQAIIGPSQNNTGQFVAPDAPKGN